MADKVPIRILVWHKDYRLDLRGWLDELVLDRTLADLQDGEAIQSYGRPGQWSARGTNADWKFHRGKPTVQ